MSTSRITTTTTSRLSVSQQVVDEGRHARDAETVPQQGVSLPPGYVRGEGKLGREGVYVGLLVGDVHSTRLFNQLNLN